MVAEAAVGGGVASCAEGYDVEGIGGVVGPFEVEANGLACKVEQAAGEGAFSPCLPSSCHVM